MRSTKSFSTACLTDRACGQRSDRVQMRERCLLWFFVCALQFICCCTAVPSAQRDDQRSITQANSNASSSGDDLIASGLFNGTPEEAKEAWQDLTKSGVYRAARVDDFRLPEAAKKGRGGDVERAIEHPYVGGDINHDGAYNDFAVIVVDKTKTEAA